MSIKYDDVLKEILNDTPELVDDPEILTIALNEFNKRSNTNNKMINAIKLRGNIILGEFRGRNKDEEIDDDDEKMMEKEEEIETMKPQPPPEKSSGDTKPRKIDKKDYIFYRPGILVKDGNLLVSLFPGFEVNRGTASFPTFRNVDCRKDYFPIIFAGSLSGQLYDLFDNLILKLNETVQELPDYQVGSLISYKKTGKFSFNQTNKKNQEIKNSEELADVYKKILEFALPKSVEFVKSKSWIPYLLSSVLHTFSVVDTKKVKSKIPCYKFDKINYVLGFPCGSKIRTESDGNFDRQILEDMKPEKSFYTIQYAKILECMKTMNVERCDCLFKNIFKNNIGVLNHYKLNDELKQRCWCQSLANLMSSGFENVNESEMIFINCWKNILNSPFCYYILMHGISCSTYFQFSIQKLLCEKISLKLLATCLYPISFLFTPFMCKSEQTPVTGKGKRIEYKKLIKRFYDEIIKIDTAERCDWIGCVSGECENKNLGLLFEVIANE
jgi:hypothetical protein